MLKLCELETEIEIRLQKKGSDFTLTVKVQCQKRLTKDEEVE